MREEKPIEFGSKLFTQIQKVLYCTSNKVAQSTNLYDLYDTISKPIGQAGQR